MNSRTRIGAIAVLIAALAGCATTDNTGPAPRALTADEGRALVSRLLPPSVRDRGGWAIDLYAAIAALGITPTPDNICAAIAITEQESGFEVDPAVPGLAAIAWKEIERQRERIGVPSLVLQAALALPSSTGTSYADRIDGVRTEKQLNDIFEDFIGRVPLGQRFLADRNPVRTGGPMQVSIAFAEAQVETDPYPYPLTGSVRQEVFTRRGGLYFGVAHLLGYPASYERHLFRFADFNAGRYASRNAAFQSAVSQATGVPLALDGDLLRYENGRPAKDAGSTELAVRALARRLDLDNDVVRRDLSRGREDAFERTTLYTRVYAQVDAMSGRPAPRAMLPVIVLQSPKITRKLTTDWFANRVETRYQRCIARGTSAPVVQRRQ